MKFKNEISEETINEVVKTNYETDRRELTEEEENFIKYYVLTLNKKMAYEKAFRGGEADSYGTLHAEEVLARPEIARRVGTLLQKALDDDVAKSPNLLLKYIQRYLELDPADFYYDDGRVIPLSQLSPENRLLISNLNKIVNGRTGNIVLSYQLPDKLKLLDYLAKLVALVTEVKAMNLNTGNEDNEAERRRQEILASVDDEDEMILDNTTNIEEIAKKIQQQQKKSKRKSKKALDD